MRPKTKLQIAVKELAIELPPLSEKQKQFAIDKLFPKLCYATKTSAFCLECGCEIDVNDIENENVYCAVCNLILKVERTKKQKFSSELGFMNVASIVRNENFIFQVIRCFEFRCYYRKGKLKDFYSSEVTQNWYTIKGDRVVNSKFINGFTGSYVGSLEIRDPNRKKNGYSRDSDYDPIPDFYHPDSKFLLEFSKMGIKGSLLKKFRFSTLIKKLKESSKIETLLKHGYYDIISKWNSKTIEKYWDTLKICFRNRYRILDADVYKDMLDALYFLGKDLRNTHYVCPKKLIVAHDFYIHEQSKIQMGKTIAENLKVAKDANPDFVLQKRKYFNLLFIEKNLQIKPLMSVMEFLEEGEFLKHCIFRNKYYEKKNSLLFSAKVDNVRVETVEICLETFRVLQHHGLGHKPSKYSEKILKLISRNFVKIQQITLEDIPLSMKKLSA